jgi:hypothetical protein
MNGLHPRRRVLAVALLVACIAQDARAGEPWLAPGNLQARHDIQLLVDQGVIELPTSAWPIAVSDLAAALEKVDERGPSTATGASAQDTAAATPEPPLLSAAQLAALHRLRGLAAEGSLEYGFGIAGAARPTDLRGFADTPREEGEISLYAASFLGTRFGGRLEFTAAANPADDRNWRLDGSYAAVALGNWIVTAGQQDRWWGPGWEGSLILSNNARPVPAISLDRAVSEPFESRWLSWLGPWRVTTFMGRMEGDRDDYAHPLLWGLRVQVMPLDGLEIALERTAQWCGEGRSCSWDDFWNLFSGNDNAGENVDAEDEPGNQLAGWTIRWASPIGDAPYALYNQHTGETIDNKIPRPYRSFDIYGVETWGESRSGGSWRAGFEYAGTRCGGTENGEKLWDCAYNNNIFTPDGYRYYGRPLGHSMDGDGEMYSARFVHVDAAAHTFSAVLRYTLINEGGGQPDLRHSIAPGPEDWISADFSYRRMLGTGWVEAGVGVDDRSSEWSGNDATLGRAYLTWQRPFR